MGVQQRVVGAAGAVPEGRSDAAAGRHPGGPGPVTVVAAQAVAGDLVQVAERRRDRCVVGGDDLAATSGAPSEQDGDALGGAEAEVDPGRAGVDSLAGPPQRRGIAVAVQRSSVQAEVVADPLDDVGPDEAVATRSPLDPPVLRLYRATLEKVGGRHGPSCGQLLDRLDQRPGRGLPRGCARSTGLASRAAIGDTPFMSRRKASSSMPPASPSAVAPRPIHWPRASPEPV